MPQSETFFFGLGQRRNTLKEFKIMVLTILSAVYGTTTNISDVTAICQKIVNTGNDDIPINNTVMGGDPDPGVVKSFAIMYSNPQPQNPGAFLVKTAVEGDTLDLVP